MPRAAPGGFARGTMRRNFPQHIRVSIADFDGCSGIRPYQMGMETILHQNATKLSKFSPFTQLFSCFEVESGRLGEVVSLVGDCRPPPPGNPRQPTGPGISFEGPNGILKDMPILEEETAVFPAIAGNSGGKLGNITKHYSLYKYSYSGNLKKLEKIQYFKNIRSYFSCVDRKLVLKFSNFHSHLCGLMVGELPSIVITNVLVT